MSGTFKYDFISCVWFQIEAICKAIQNEASNGITLNFAVMANGTVRFTLRGTQETVQVGVGLLERRLTTVGSWVNFIFQARATSVPAFWFCNYVNCSIQNFKWLNVSLYISLNTI